MSRRFVPVTLGSPRFDTVDVGGLTLTHACFPPGLRLPPHQHDRACFAVVLDGSFDVRFARRTHDCPTATVWTEPAGERHGNRAERAGARVLVVQPDSRRAEELRALEELVCAVHHFRHAEIAGLAARAALELQQPDAVSALSLESLALEMLVTAARRQRSADGAEPRPPKWLLQAQEYLHAHFRERLNLTRLAQQAGVHPVHLSRVFRRQFGVSIGDYARGLRLDWAAERLASSAEPLCDISLEAGFADQSHFTRVFRRHTGLTPRRYRTARAPASRRCC